MTRVTLLLASGPGKSDGDLHDRLVLDLGLTATGQLDYTAYDAAPQPWLASRVRPGRPTLSLEVIRIDESWALQSTTSLDDPVWAFEGHVFRPGELIRLRNPSGQELLYRIVASEQVEPQASDGVPPE